MYIKETKETNQYFSEKRGTYTRSKTIYHFKCDSCGKEFTRPKNGKLNMNANHLCQTCNTPDNKQKLSVQSKLKNSEIRGTKFDRGYKEVWVGDDYPYRDTRWVREHIKVMEEHIESKIPKGYVVHHIDGSKTNNELDNLLLCSVADHNNCHAKIERLVFELYKQGLVDFDKENLEYYFKGA